MLKGFKEFILRGNVMELAVGIIIGGAFTAIVTAITDKIINPLIAAIGPPDMDGLGFYVRSGMKSTFMDFGAVITAAINFIIIAAVVYFIIVVPMNKLAAMRQTDEEIPPTQEELLTEIRDLLAQNAAANAAPGQPLPGDPAAQGNPGAQGNSGTPQH